MFPLSAEKRCFKLDNMNVRRCKTLTFSTAQIGTMLPVPWPTTTHLRLAVRADVPHRLLSTGDLRVTTLPQAWKGAEGRDSYVVSSLRGSRAASRLPDTKYEEMAQSRLQAASGSLGEMKAMKNSSTTQVEGYGVLTCAVLAGHGVASNTSLRRSSIAPRLSALSGEFGPEW